MDIRLLLSAFSVLLGEFPFPDISNFRLLAMTKNFHIIGFHCSDNFPHPHPQHLNRQRLVLKTLKRKETFSAKEKKKFQASREMGLTAQVFGVINRPSTEMRLTA